MARKYEPLRDHARALKALDPELNSLQITELVHAHGRTKGLDLLPNEKTVRNWITDVEPDTSEEWDPRTMSTEDAKAVLRCLRSYLWVPGRYPGEDAHQRWVSQSIAETIAEVARFLPVTHSQGEIFNLARVLLAWRAIGASETPVWQFISHQVDPPSKDEDVLVARTGSNLTQVWKKVWQSDDPLAHIPTVEMYRVLSEMAIKEQEQDR